MTQKQRTLVKRVIDWLNEEGLPEFSLDPEYPGPGPSGAGSGRVASRGGKGLIRRLASALRRRKRGEVRRGLPSAAPRLTGSLEENLRRIRTTFHLPESSDILLKEVEIPLRKPRRVAVLFVNAMIDKRVLDADLLGPLLSPDPARVIQVENALVEGKLERLFPQVSVDLKDSLDSIAWEIMSGKIAVIVDGFSVAVLADAAGWRHRDVNQPVNERVVRGPHQAFVEPLKINVTLVRRIIRSPDLVVELTEVGSLSRTEVAVVYIAGVTNPRLVDEVKKRLNAIRLDYVSTDGELEQLLDERTGSVIPSTMITERPDRFAAHIAEGYVGVFTDNAPAGIIIPSTAADLLQNPEDFYTRWPYGTFLRLLRFLGFLIAMFAPAVYVATINYHQEMVPTNLLFSIGATREAVPLPSILNVWITLLAFDLIQEAGIRVPAPIGPTIGIVGALLIGEAAVRASLLTPAEVILIAVTAVSSYTISSPQLAIMVRVSKYLFLAASALWGLLGVGLVGFGILVYLCSIRNFGVPFMIPFAPRVKGAPDVTIRGPLWKMERRPVYLRPLEPRIAPPVTRRWMKRRDNPNDDPGR
ncbi:MAG: spore germination protein [Firmicutes bacterium]|nr:spore germination protein [Bacillota bacterium]